METQHIGFAAFHLQGIYQEEIVEDLGACGYRVRDVQVEELYAGFEEVGPQKMGSRVLSQYVFQLEAGHVAVTHHLPLEGRILAMVHVGDILGDEGGNEGLSGNGRCVRIFFHEAYVAVYETDIHQAVHLGGVQFNLTVQAAAPVGGVVRVVYGEVLADFPENGADVAVIRLYIGGVQLSGVWPEGKINLRERALLDFHGKAFVADDLGGEHLGLGRTGFQAVPAIHISGNADGGAVKINAYEGKGLSGFGIFHHTADTGSALCSSRKGHTEG